MLQRFLVLPRKRKSLLSLPSHQGNPEKRPLKVLKELVHTEILLGSKALNSEADHLTTTEVKGKRRTYP